MKGVFHHMNMYNQGLVKCSAEDDQFGYYNVDISADGSTLVVSSAKSEDSPSDTKEGAYSYFRFYRKDSNDEWALVTEKKRWNVDGHR